MRTGKTVISTTVAESRYYAGLINQLIIIAPLRTKKVWEEHLSIPYEFHALEHFSNPHTRDKIDFLCDDKTMVVLDESLKFKNIGVIRYDKIIDICYNRGYTCIYADTKIVLQSDTS